MAKIILLVEDDLTDEKLTLRVLKKSRVANEVVVARDGPEALDYLFGTGGHAARDLSILPTLVLLDLRLPKIDGLEVLRRIRSDERTKLVPVVILTSSAHEEDVLSSYTFHANAYVRKPIDTAAFEAAVERLGLFWLLTNVLPQSFNVGPLGVTAQF